MPPSPRLLLTIDYESWYALARRYNTLSSDERRTLDGNFGRDAIDLILEKLQDTKVSFFLVGELVEWYPDLPQKITKAGHEVGFHCHVHRPLTTIEDIKNDLDRSSGWRAKYNVRGYRAPMIRTIEALYPILQKNQFVYSSSLYAPTGTRIQKGGIWEFPVSTYPFFGLPENLLASRHMSLSLLLSGEFPYASSMMSGLFPRTVFKIIEHELKRGLSPVIFLHPYEIVRPDQWPGRLARDILAYPPIYPFTLSKVSFLDKLLRAFPISPMIDFISESINDRSAS